ncbi:MAG: DUF4394 domain-containing protein [Alphaproteobacteria bacterium]|nr:DUF4394 domain-containing protein [Alphaproteobacteria bacterium]
MKFRTVLAASAAVIMGVAAAQAAEVAALSGDNTISIVNTGTKSVTKTWKIQGIAGRVAGIDVRPADGRLYALAADGGVYTVDLATGKATMKSRLDTMLKPGVWATVDFNPVADRLRVIGSDGMNLRANVDDGKVIVDGALKFADGDAAKGKAPKVAAGAYVNSVKGAKETTLFNVELATGALVRQAPPNDGVLNTIGTLGVKAETVAFDIWSDGKGKNEAWLMAGDWLHSVDLSTGKATPAVQIKGVSSVRDIAVLPAM